MLAGHSGPTSSNSSGSRDARRAEHDPASPTVDTQLRSRDASGRLMVKFETAGAAQQALKAEALIKAAAYKQQQQQQQLEGLEGGDGDTADDTSSRSYAAAVAGGSSRFKGGWFVDLFHAGIHRAIEAAAGVAAAAVGYPVSNTTSS